MYRRAYLRTSLGSDSPCKKSNGSVDGANLSFVVWFGCVCALFVWFVIIGMLHVKLVRPLARERDAVRKQFVRFDVCTCKATNAKDIQFVQQKIVRAFGSLGDFNAQVFAVPRAPCGRPVHHRRTRPKPGAVR